MEKLSRTNLIECLGGTVYISVIFGAFKKTAKAVIELLRKGNLWKN